MQTATEVIILQHPMEVNNAKGSARLLHLSLPNSRLLIGETFSDALLQQLVSTVDGGRIPILLYPENPDATQHSATVCALPDEHNRLIVLDGTWRKSRKMLHLNPVLQQLPRLALHDLPPSRYSVRKAQREEQRSTLEASCHALLQLGESAHGVHQLLRAFDGFVAQQASYLD